MTSIFLSPVGGQNDRELGLLLDRSGGGRATSRSGGDGDGGGGRDAPLGFEQFGEFSRFEDGQARQFVDDFFQISHCHQFLYGSNHGICEEPSLQAASLAA